MRTIRLVTMLVLAGVALRSKVDEERSCGRPFPPPRGRRDRARSGIGVHTQIHRAGFAFSTATISTAGTRSSKNMARTATPIA